MLICNKMRYLYVLRFTLIYYDDRVCKNEKNHEVLNSKKCTELTRMYCTYLKKLCSIYKYKMYKANTYVLNMLKKT